ncbi:MAG TPA: leucine-rich repeat protein, partial [Prolixibacteraceae bacterium]|nr:leucine-rich repeat protein [Prolixibacteraceae bacterium]
MKSTIKKISMILTGLLFSMVLCAQVAVTVDNTPGNLKNNLADKDPGSIVSLTITGTMDARDFKFMRDEMQRLVNVDLRQTTIVAYSGEGGTYPPDYSVYYDYYSNTIPDNAFGHYGLSTNITLKSVQIPLNTLAIGETAFAHCEALTSFTVPSSVTLIGASAFAGCKGLTSFIVPPTVNYIASGVFAECSSLKEVVLPPSLTVIEYLLFEECSSLVSIKIPSGVTSIGSRAFAGCASLADIELPSGLISIGFEAFRGCTSMVNINLPSSVTTIATNAFLGCTALTAISLPSGITKLGQGVFYDCNSLTGKLAIPGGIKSIKEYTFSNCSKLTSIEFSMGTDSIRESAFEGCIAFSGKLTLPSTLVFIGNRAFSGCSLITGELSLPPFLKSIGMFAFAGCRGLNSLTIPPSAESIDEWAFKDCSGLTSIVAGNPYPIALGNGSGVFEGVNKSIPLKVPFGSKELYASAGGWKEFTNIIEESKGIHLSVTTASFGPEGGSNSSITLKANVAWTASSDQAWLAVSPTSGSSSQVLTLTALANTGMTSRTGIITLSSTGLETQSLHVTQESVPYVVQTTTGNFRSLFTDEQYNSITRLTITGTMNAPDIGALRDMPRLAEVDMSGVSITAYHYTIYKDHYTMPANSLPGIEYLSKYSLQYDSSLTSIILPSNLEKIEAEAFKDCLNLTSVTFPSTLTYIGQCAFMNCAGLKEVKLPSSLMQLGNQAFYGCSNLSNVELPESITSLSATFAECTSLKTIKLPSTLKIIGEYTFQGCVQLSQIEIPSQVTTIGMEAFLGCTGLTSVLLPSSVTTIQSDAFTGCSILKRVTLPRSLVSIGTRAFGDCTTLSAVYCYAVHPPLLDNSSNFPVFLNVDMAHCMLYVPFGSKVLYEQAEQWKEFKNIVEMDEFRLPITSFSMEAGQGSVTVAVTSAVQWTATSDQSWLSVSPGSANGSATVTLIAQANASFVTRSAKVAFTINDQQSQDITVIQKGIPATIELTAGNLSSEFSLDELIGMTRLSITGTIDARDFKTIRDRMPSLTELDISAATIAAYKGFDGTVAAYLYEPGQYDANGYYYPANEIPPYALYNGEYDNRERKIIRSIHLPDSLQSIGTYAFYRLTQLDSMIIPPAVTNIGSNAFAGTSSLTTVVLPPKLRHFPIYLFYNSGLTSINIPPAVTFIGYLAFGNCKNLTTVYSNALFPPEADLDYNFQGAPMFGLDKSNITLYVPYGARGAYAAAPNEWKEFTNVVELPGFRLSAAILAVKAAQGSTAKAAIQSDVQWTATSDQSWLAVSPSSGTGADSITFTAQANTMDAGRKATVIISAPDVVSQTITVIQEGKPRSIALTPGNMASVLTSEEMSGITNLTITGVMDARDFRIMKDQMPLLTYLDMSKVKIAEFQEPDPITGEIFTNRVNMIPNGAFFDQKTWKGKTSLTEVIFPQTLEKIGLRAFSNAAGLTVLRFPFTMRYIEMNAFNNCPYVTSIYSYALAPPPSHDWGTSFYNVDKTNCILYVPYGSKELYAASQWWKDFQNIVEMAEFKIMTSKATM